MRRWPDKLILIYVYTFKYKCDACCLATYPLHLDLFRD
jgi:hypothetical protein